MALKDLAIRPRFNTLHYASGAFAEMRAIFQELENANYTPAKMRLLAKAGRGRAISAKATVDDAIAELEERGRRSTQPGDRLGDHD